MGQRYGDKLLWNPIANYIELLRGTFIHPDPPGELKLEYTAWVTMSLLALGLLLERYIRPKQEAV
jgi:ABC-type polysaccharide/polyol phosphate export permease